MIFLEKNAMFFAACFGRWQLESSTYNKNFIYFIVIIVFFMAVIVKYLVLESEILQYNNLDFIL